MLHIFYTGGGAGQKIYSKWEDRTSLKLVVSYSCWQYTDLTIYRIDEIIESSTINNVTS